MRPTWESDGVQRDVRIYVLIENDTNEVRYVGKTVSPLQRRLTQHKQMAKRGKTWLARWLLKMQREGRAVAILELEVVPANGDWPSAEKAWIGKFKSDGCRLVNATDGGEGLAGHVFTSEHREKISKALYSRQTMWCAHCWKLFDAKLSEIRDGNGRFCSRECYFSWQVGKKKKVVSPEYGRAGRMAQARKRRLQTHCKRGHPLCGNTLYVNRSGRRVCKECRKIHKKAHRAKKAYCQFIGLAALGF